MLRGGYPQRVSDSLLPLSVGGSLPEAFEEWFFTGDVEDHDEPIETCQLCGQQDLRYHFEIRNKYTDKTLWVGSHCILQFNVAIFEDGRRLTLKEAKRTLDKLTAKMQLEACVRALKKLAQSENNEILRNAVAYYERNKKLTPKFAFVVFWRLRANHVEHHPSFFNITLKKKKYVDDLAEMPTERVHFFWSALTTQQKRKCMELGHAPPPPKS